MQKIEPHRSLAGWFLELVKSEYMNDDVEKFLIWYLTWIIRNVRQQRVHDKKIKLADKEEHERVQELDDIEDLLESM